MRKHLKNNGGFLSHATTTLAKKYGPLVGMRLGRDRQVIACGYQAVKEMLTDKDIDGRPQGPSWEVRTWGSRRGCSSFIYSKLVIKN